jgi:hypothetical protein
MEVFLPNHEGDERVRAVWARTQRLSATRGMALKYWDLMEKVNALDVLPSITVPALVLARTGDLAVPIESQRLIASEIPGAELVELPGNDHLLWLGDVDAVLDAIEEFVTGTQRPRARDRTLARDGDERDAVGRTQAEARGQLGRDERRGRPRVEQKVERPLAVDVYGYDGQTPAQEAHVRRVFSTNNPRPLCVNQKQQRERRQPRRLVPTFHRVLPGGSAVRSSRRRGARKS